MDQQCKSEPIGFLMHHPDNVIGAFEVLQNQHFLRTYLSATVGVDFLHSNIDEIVKDLSTLSGQYSEAKMRNIMGACFLLHHYLPKLKNLALELGHLNYEMLRTIWYGLVAAPCFGTPGELWRRIDEFLVDKLSPHYPRQAMPTWQYIRQALQDELIRLGLYDDPEDPDVPSKETAELITQANFGVELIRSSQVGASTMIVTMPSDTAHIVKEHIEVAAKDQGIRQDEVIAVKICGEPTTTPTHTVQIFGVCEIDPDEQVTMVHAQSIGRLTKTQQLRLSQDYTYVNAASIAEQCRATHDPTPAQRMVVMLRDGTCRFPGCTVDARKCDIDHVINHKAGGWTTVSNLQSLCRHHHNFKTDRHVHATSDEYGIITWEFNTGQTITTQPLGALGGIIAGPSEGITGRHPNATESEEYSRRPPGNHGLGRWGTTLQKQRNKQRKRHLERYGIPLSAGDQYLDWLEFQVHAM
ncbi:HNH endonuclease [Corynebacterium freiburgense]|uniref:HNH endonuclease n=1 Tax=Corynebacterium freiburgense TaxID=556548 RepID=UPI0003F9CA67|nr:HNH endonuclease signature motif containing protein [Corynebacterium freiburgense]WJZ03402.1 hypothetical protein CFREI_10640 [Corynebacterium freiburgense]